MQRQLARPCSGAARAAAPRAARALRLLPRRAPALRVRAARQQQDPQQQQQQQQQQRRRGLFGGPAKQSGSRKQTPQLPDPDQGWRPFAADAYDAPWAVPWGAGATAGVMGLWVLGFAATAFLAAPASYVALTGTPLRELGPSGQAEFALWSELLEIAVTAGILWFVVSRHDPEEVAEQRLFDFSPAAPLARPRGWLFWALFGAGLAPLVVGAAAYVLSAVGYESAVAGGRGTVDGVAGMLSLDAGTYLRLIGVTGVLAPLLEETLFRGFLLTSFTKFMPVPAAVFASSLAFGAAHLSLKDLPVLVTLGCLLGAVYVRSRNLLSPMLIHGLWNSTVLTVLFALTAAGVDVQALLREGAP